ncbi:MAG: phosphotransferase [Micrococcales bacterium]|nr:phosphotransferase [Micrococcales bacterium]
MRIEPERAAPAHLDPAHPAHLPFARREPESAHPDRAPDPAPAFALPGPPRAQPEPAPDPALPQRLRGKVGGAVRVGDTVLRPIGPWTPAVHALLEHLARAGLRGVPGVAGIEGGREVLPYIPGRSLDPDAELASDAELAGAVTWLRDYHAAVASFRPTEPLRWRSSAEPMRLAADQIVTHNDPGAYNWVVSGGAFVGMIDWDMAGPGHPLEDLAFLCWTGIPLHRELLAADAARRLRRVARLYGGFTPAEILDAAVARMRVAAERIAAGQRRGDPGLLALGQAGEPERTLERLADFAVRRPAIDAALASG